MEKKSCCAGSCYLSKQLKENEEKQETTPLNEKQRVEYVANIFDNTFSFYSFSTNNISANFPILWSFGQTKTFIGSIFHPPSLLG
ncbi:MAG: hypothetical protein H7282_08730 [Cytophagaceae bacterium]|nr:hypothetical protein [Cytophagaceae bacterium]